MTTTDLVLPDGVVPATAGLVFPDDMPYEQWAEFGETLTRAEGSYLWAVGDWMHYGAEHYGAKAIQLAAAVGLSERSVWNATSVCKRVPFDRRRPELSFSHHDTVASLAVEDQIGWLQVAVDEGLSVSALRDHVAAARERPAVTVGGKPRRVPVRFNVTMPADAVPDEVMQEGVHHAATALKTFLAERGYETDIAEVL